MVNGLIIAELNKRKLLALMAHKVSAYARYDMADEYRMQTAGVDSITLMVAASLTVWHGLIVLVMITVALQTRIVCTASHSPIKA